MRFVSIQDLYDDNDQLKAEELRRLTPGTREFAILDETIRAVRRRPAMSNWRLFHRLNIAYYADARIEDGEIPDQTLAGLGTCALSSLQSFLTLPPRAQRYVHGDDGAMADLLQEYLAMRDWALTEPAPLPFDWQTRGATPTSRQENIEHMLSRLSSARNRDISCTRPSKVRGKGALRSDVPDIL